MQCLWRFRSRLRDISEVSIQTFEYRPKNVCARPFLIRYDGNRIVEVKITGGCTGNTQGVARLCEGRDIDEVISLLEGIRCPASLSGMTSCPDQLAQALKQIQTQERKL